MTDALRFDADAQVRPTFVSLFAGVGGMDLAFEAAGWQCVGQVEIDDFCNRILSLRWPDVYRVRDVRTCTGRTGKGWRRYHRLPRVDALIGGFPCQDVSAAGKGAGIRVGTRSGLWFEFARLIGELRPRLVLLENVPAITTRDGLIVAGSLTRMGYDGRWGTIRASDAGTSHLRKRWFCVAHPISNHRQASPHTGKRRSVPIVGHDATAQEPQRDELESWTGVHSGELGNATSQRCEGYGATWQSIPATGRQQELSAWSSDHAADTRPTQSRLGGDVNGLSAWMDRSYESLHVARPGQPQHDWEPARITNRRDFRASRLKALGNAVVPQVIYPIACAMREWLEVSA